MIIFHLDCVNTSLHSFVFPEFHPENSVVSNGARWLLRCFTLPYNMFLFVCIFLDEILCVSIIDHFSKLFILSVTKSNNH